MMVCIVISHEYGLWAMLVCDKPGRLQETDHGGSDQLVMLMLHLPKDMTEKKNKGWVLGRDGGWQQKQHTANRHWAPAVCQALC